MCLPTFSFQSGHQLGHFSKIGHEMTEEGSLSRASGDASVFSRFPLHFHFSTLTSTFVESWVTLTSFDCHATNFGLTIIFSASLWRRKVVGLKIRIWPAHFFDIGF